MLKKFSLFALTLLLLAALNVPLAAAEKPYLEDPGKRRTVQLHFLLARRKTEFGI